MTKAEKFLDWWILNNVVKSAAEPGEKEARARRLAEMCAKAAAQLGIDEQDPALDRQRLYERMIAAIEQAG